MRSRRSIGKELGKVRTGLPRWSRQASSRPRSCSRRLPARHLAIEALDDRADLVAPAALVQREVHADAVQPLRHLRQLDLAVKHAATLQGMVRDVLVLGAQDRVAAEDGVAVVAVVVDGVAPVGEVRPHLVGEKFVLRLVGPVLETRGVAAVLPLHFLEEDDVRAEELQMIAQLVDHHAAVELRKALVDVVGGDV